MIVCRTCGFRNQAEDAFCGSCGGFLEWTGEKQTPKVAVEVVQEIEQQQEQAAWSLMPGLLWSRTTSSRTIGEVAVEVDGVVE